MTRAQLIRLYENENGYTPSEDEIELLMDQYHLGDADADLPPPRRVYQFKNYSNDSRDSFANDLFSEIKNIFTEIAGSAKRSSDKVENENLNEFTFMAIVFLLKAGLYFSLKAAYARGFDFANL